MERRLLGHSLLTQRDHPELVEDLEGLSGWRDFIADYTGIKLNIEA